MDIYLIRHTQTNTAQGLCYGQTDVPLASSFESDAELIRQKLPSLLDNCLVIASPLSRCLKLAQTFSDKLITDPRLKEIYFGDWENRLFNDIDNEQLLHWINNFVKVSPPNGESFSDLCQRAAEFWHELLSKNPAEQVVIVTHAGVIRALLVQVLQLIPEHAFKIRVDFGSVHKLEHSNDYTAIHYLNL